MISHAAFDLDMLGSNPASALHDHVTTACSATFVRLRILVCSTGTSVPPHGLVQGFEEMMAAGSLQMCPGKRNTH